MNNLDEFKKLQDEVQNYHRDNSYQIKKHFKNEKRETIPWFKLSLAFVSIILVVFIVQSKILPLNNNSVSKSPITDSKYEVPTNSDTDKSDQTESVPESKPIIELNDSIVKVIKQEYNQETKKYKVTVSDANGNTILTDYDKELKVNENYYLLDGQLYEVRFENEDWYYLDSDTWKKVTP